MEEKKASDEEVINAVDRARDKIVDFEISTTKDFEPYYYLARRYI